MNTPWVVFKVFNCTGTLPRECSENVAAIPLRAHPQRNRHQRLHLWNQFSVADTIRMCNAHITHVHANPLRVSIFFSSKARHAYSPQHLRDYHPLTLSQCSALDNSISRGLIQLVPRSNCLFVFRHPVRHVIFTAPRRTDRAVLRTYSNTNQLPQDVSLYFVCADDCE